MVVKQGQARKVGSRFAEAVCQDRSVVGLWTTTRDDGIHLWLVIHDVGDAEEQHFYELLDVLDDRFAGTDVQLHVLSPASYTVDPRDVLPDDAEEIPCVPVSLADVESVVTATL